MAPNRGLDESQVVMKPEVQENEAVGTSPATAAAAAGTPTPTQQHVLNCQFSHWHPLFKHCTPRSAILELPEEVVRYLQEDGVMLPKGFEMSCGGGVKYDSDDEVDWGNDDSDEDGQEDRPDFPGLHVMLKDAIASLGGAVFPKLNWSCPKDAAWVNGGSLKCSQPGDVLCLLKSSTFISHDLNHAFDACTDAAISRPDKFTLVLRKWCNLHPSMLFRCFIRERRLVGACQRDCTSYYGFLEEEADRLSTALADFMAAEVCKKFPDADCVADVYVDNRSRVWLLDINPFSAVTDSLLFDWSEDVLAAPLPPATTTPRHEEDALPPDVFMRIHFTPSNPPPGDGDTGGPPESPSRGSEDNGSSSCRFLRQQQPEQQPKESGAEADANPAEGLPRNVLAGATGFTLAGGGEGADFELRCVPSSLHMVPDPMGRYRGPADVGMGTLMCGAQGGGEGVDLADLIESCRLAASSET